MNKEAIFFANSQILQMLELVTQIQKSDWGKYRGECTKHTDFSLTFTFGNVYEAPESIHYDFTLINNNYEFNSLMVQDDETPDNYVCHFTIFKKEQLIFDEEFLITDTLKKNMLKFIPITSKFRDAILHLIVFGKVTGFKKIKQS